MVLLPVWVRQLVLSSGLQEGIISFKHDHILRNSLFICLKTWVRRQLFLSLLLSRQLIKEDRLSIVCIPRESIENKAFVHTSWRTNFSSDDLPEDLIRQAWFTARTIKLWILLLTRLLIISSFNVLDLLNLSLDLIGKIIASLHRLINHIFDLQVRNTVCLSKLGCKVRLA